MTRIDLSQRWSRRAQRVGQPPSDAIVLFDGKDLSKWTTKGKPAGWTVENGYTFAPTRGVGDLVTKEKFGDIQLHIEFAAPTEIRGYGQNRANSGVLLMSRYEIQVLDSSADNPTYADGQAGSIYGQWPPPVNVSRKPGEWQTYDIVFEAPKFEGEKLVKPAFVTVFHNGVLMHHHKEIIGRDGPSSRWNLRSACGRRATGASGPRYTRSFSQYLGTAATGLRPAVECFLHAINQSVCRIFERAVLSFG